MNTNATSAIGVIGLGIMGLSYARHLIAAGYRVVGFDVASPCMEAFTQAGGHAAASPREVAAACFTILTALPSEKALNDICAGPDGIVAGLRQAATLCELSTLPIKAKEECRAALEAAGGVMLDCPVSGTGVQAARGEIEILASGDEGRVEALRPLFAAISRRTHYVGPFGNGMKYKCIANLLVTIHNVAAAEALALARKAGLDPGEVLGVLATGAGASKMLELRGPLMVEDRYLPATAKVGVHLKDIDLIEAFARANGAQVALFEASIPFYRMAAEDGRWDQDTASVFAVIDSFAAAANADPSPGAVSR